MKFADIVNRDFNELLQLNEIGIEQIVGEKRSKEIDQKIKMIARMTDNNDHGGAILAGLNVLSMSNSASKIKPLIKEIEKINKEHQKLGHLPSELSSDRAQIYTKMMLIAKKIMGEKYKAFHGAF